MLPRLIALTLLIWLSFSAFAAQDMNARFIALTKEIRCVACLNQSIADSEAPLAVDLRKKMKNMMLAGASDEKIKQYLTARYGQFVLFKPKWQPSTWMLWLFPWLAIIIASMLIYQLLRKMRTYHPE